MSLFELPPLPPVEERERESYTVRLTRRRAELLDAGIHPTTRVALRQPVGAQTCGTCAHHFVRHLGGTYHKCDAVAPTGGPATDVRVSWPACTRFEATP